ncbi:MAG: GNAT family N-acetyltransferase [Halioglobus sp.]
MSNKADTKSAIQVERRRLLIDATMSAISEHGLSQLTLAKISSVAGLSAGSVNFHFTSKEALLLETLTFLAEEFEQGIDSALAQAGPEPATKLLALLDASVDPAITEPRKMAVWFAFTAEARGREDYQRICGGQDQKILNLTQTLCKEIINEGKRQNQMHAGAMANAVQGLVDEIWQDILYAGDDYNRKEARFMYLSFLSSVFPWAYEAPTRRDSETERLSTGDKSLRIITAKTEHINDVAQLFDLYRQFYEEPADLRLARRFIGQNIKQERSTILLALDESGRALGFTQLYPQWCSVAAQPFMTLYDLYVDDSARNLGVARELMAAAEKAARRAKACRIDLETARDNHSAQALYEDLGYEREQVFYKYSLALD